MKASARAPQRRPPTQRLRRVSKGRAGIALVVIAESRDGPGWPASREFVRLPIRPPDAQLTVQKGVDARRGSGRAHHV